MDALYEPFQRERAHDNRWSTQILGSTSVYWEGILIKAPAETKGSRVRDTKMIVTGLKPNSWKAVSHRKCDCLAEGKVQIWHQI